MFLSVPAIQHLLFSTVSVDIWHDKSCVLLLLLSQQHIGLNYKIKANFAQIVLWHVRPFRQISNLPKWIDLPEFTLTGKNSHCPILACIITGKSWVLLPVLVSGTDVGQPCTPGGTPCADRNAACVRNICTCRQGFFSLNGFCSKWWNVYKPFTLISHGKPPVFRHFTGT